MTNSNLTLFAENISDQKFFYILKDKIRVNTIKSLSFLPSNIISYFHNWINFRINRVLRESFIQKRQNLWSQRIAFKDLFQIELTNLHTLLEIIIII